jgi:glycosyltransferase involved in cell wall biosynthesis
LLNIIIVIPTFNPTDLLVTTLSDLNSYPQIKGLTKIIVNDGSTSGEAILSRVKEDDPNVVVLSHDENSGKGSAIKTAIRFILDQSHPIDYALTVDSDNQHSGKDVAGLLESAKNNNQCLHIGVRRLDKEKTPLRSFWGNLLSRKIFQYLFDFELWDTQSGLRAYPKSCFGTLLSLASNRYEFEMEAVIALIKQKFQICETSVETTYLERNKSSHFRPFVDSYRVIWVMLKMRLKKF